jgi:hypothetical protein
VLVAAAVNGGGVVRAIGSVPQSGPVTVAAEVVQTPIIGQVPQQKEAVCVTLLDNKTCL